MADPYGLGLDLGIDDPLSGLGLSDPLGVSSRRRRSSRPSIDYPEISPEQEQSLLSQLSSGALSGLSYVGGMLDKFTGSRALRGALTGRPRELLSIIPGSDTFGITDRSQIASGKDVLGIQNDPTAWGDDIAGFGAEMLLDPTLFFGGFIKGGVTQAGKLAKAANVFDDVVEAGVKAGKGGKRVAAMKSTLREAARDPEVLSKLQTAAKGQGLGLDELLDMPLGSTLDVRLPFTGKHLGTIGEAGGMGEKISGFQDRVGEALRWGNIPGTNYSPGMHAAQLFDPRTGGLETRAGQERFAQLHRKMPEQISKASEPIYKAVQDVTRVIPTNQQTQDIAFALREYAETGAPPAGVNLPQEALDAIDSVKSLYGPALAQRQQLGRGNGLELKDVIEYWTRYLTNPGTKFGRGAKRVLDPTAESQIAREEFLKNITGGTQTIREMAQTLGGNPNLTGGEVAQAFGNMAPNHDPKMWNQVAAFIKRLTPEQIEAGVFGNHPLSDAMSYFKHETKANAHAEGIYDLLHKGIQQGASLPPGEGQTLKYILHTAGLSDGDFTGGAVKQIADRMGLTFPDQDAFDMMKGTILDAPVSPAIAKDVGRLAQPFKAPKEAGKIVSAYDSLTNLFKAGVLTWPSRYTRDLSSGTVQNILAGQFSPRDTAMAKAIMAGKVVDATDIPIVQKMVSDAGLPLNKQTAYDALQRHLASVGIISTPQSSMAQIGSNVPTGPGSIQDLTAQLPGTSPVTITGALKKVLPRSWEEANPLNIRGVGDRAETKFAPVLAGNDAGTLTDGMNRLGPYLTLLRQGVDPMEARSRVLSAQVDYSNAAFTPTEQEVMTRIAPFYRYSKGMAGHVIPEIANNPSGNLAQAVRGTARIDAGDNEFVPEHLQQSMSIGLPGTPEGQMRFLTGLGLMHEDPLNLFRPGQNSYDTFRGTGQELLGRINPLIKAPIELATDRQFFTGRELQDLDSSVGRTISNLGITENPPDVPILLDQALSNSPVSRILSTIRTATDPRKGAGVKALNLGTGVRITDVDQEKARNIAIREGIEKNLRGQGGVNTLRPHLFVKPEEWNLLSDREKALYTLYVEQAKESQKKAKLQKLEAK